MASSTPEIEMFPPASERVIVSAPMSLHGSASRIWRLRRLRPQRSARVALGTLAVILIALAWCAVLVWYALFGLFLVPYRLVRRGERKRRREDLRHRETLAAIERRVE